jgi:hypothetical protein
MRGGSRLPEEGVLVSPRLAADAVCLPAHTPRSEPSAAMTVTAGTMSASRREAGIGVFMTPSAAGGEAADASRSPARLAASRSEEDAVEVDTFTWRAHEASFLVWPGETATASISDWRA